MRIAYFSPLNPMKSGVSDYSEELLPYLARYIDIDLYVDNYKPCNQEITANFNIYNFSEFPEINRIVKYDEVVYHMGNNSSYHNSIYNILLQYPGIVVIHDYSIHHLIAYRTVAQNNNQAYIDEMFYNYGEQGRQFATESLQGKRRVMWETGDTLIYPANKRLLYSSKGAIVHSRYIGELARDVRPDIPIKYVPLHTPEVGIVSEEEKKKLRMKYGLPLDKTIFASFGFISRAKRIDAVIRCMKRLSQDYTDFIYLLVGEEEIGVYEMSKYIKELGLGDYAKYLGFVGLDKFKDYIKLSDVCINLRYPTQGETSASLIRILGMGKPALVTNIGTFMEMPDDFCLKVNVGETEEDDIYRHVKGFLDNPGLIKNKGKAAYQYIKQNHTTEVAAKKYFEFIKDIYTGRAVTGNPFVYTDLINTVSDRLCELGICNDDDGILGNVAVALNGLI